MLNERALKYFKGFQIKKTTDLELKVNIYIDLDISYIKKEKQKHVPKGRAHNETYSHYSKIPKFVLKTGNLQKSSQKVNKI